MIPDESDLNNYLNPGNYYTNLSASAKTMLNCPVQNSFVLRVENTDGGGNEWIRQTIRSSISNETWMRIKRGPAYDWMDWEVISPTGILSNLTTTTKDSLVSAVNEVNENKTTLNKTGINLTDLKDYITTNKKGNFMQSTVLNQGSALAIVSPYNNYGNGYCSFIVFGYYGTPTIYKLTNGVWDEGTEL